MQWIILTAFALGFAFADTYPEGTACHTNLECNMNCPNSEWTITARDNKSFFVCNTAITDPTQYYRGQCVRVQGTANTPLKLPDYLATARACNYFGGVSCDRACIFDGTESAEKETRKTWAAACKKTGTVMMSMMISDNEDESKSGVGCP